MCSISAKSSFFGSRSQGLNSVRRQLYSDISKVSSESSQIDIKPTQFQKPSNPKPLVPKQIGTRKSQLMPPNTIKNQILRRSSNAVSSQDKKSTTTRSTIANVKIPQSKLFGKSLNKGARCEPVVSKQDNFTMTSPTEFPEETSGYIFLPSFKINVKIESQVQGDRAQLQRVKSTLEESIKSVAAHLAQLQFAHSTLMQILNSEEHPKNNVVKVYEDEGEEFQELGRLSTIGEVSCEIDNSCLSKEKIKTDEPEENKENKVFLSPPKNVKIPKTPRSGRRKTISGPVNMLRRRSERLSAKLVKSKSNPVEDEEDDSFANLENALHVLPDNDAIETLPQITSKSAPVTPRALQKWDKKNQGPLKEYMALKLNGTFLVTPDAKKFQSRIDGTETPHSRKSLSRKIFQELCDLYAESPEHN